MDKIELGQTGIKVSRLGLGTVKFGRNEGVKYPEKFELPAERELEGLLDEAKNLGINLLDTAPAYGHSEERLGRLLKAQRKDWVIIGKAGEEFADGKSLHDFSASHFEQSLARSLKRLQTDYLDILLIHSDGSDLKILSDDALLKKMQDFKKRGLVRAIGASTKTVDGGLKALERMDTVMATYTPSYIAEKQVLDYATKHRKGVFLKKALASGHEKDIAASLTFAFSHPGTTAVITGTINREHLRQNAEAVVQTLSS